jgi:L-threonylcarbamoyladenylate synthase
MDNFKEDIINACKTLSKGGLILYPTDTIWGIGCDATNEEAVGRVYALKKRTDSKAMIVLVDSPETLYEYVEEVPDIAYDIAKLSESPVTIIYPAGKNLSQNLLAEDKSIGIRVTNEIFSQTLCRTFRKPIVSTSANISGMPSPQCFSDISEVIKSGVDYVTQYGRDDKTAKKPSSIIQIKPDNTVKIIRK